MALFLSSSYHHPFSQVMRGDACVSVCVQVLISPRLPMITEQTRSPISFTCPQPHTHTLAAHDQQPVQYFATETIDEICSIFFWFCKRRLGIRGKEPACRRARTIRQLHEKKNAKYLETKVNNVRHFASDVNYPVSLILSHFPEKKRGTKREEESFESLDCLFHEISFHSLLALI